MAKIVRYLIITMFSGAAIYLVWPKRAEVDANPPVSVEPSSVSSQPLPQANTPEAKPAPQKREVSSPDAEATAAMTGALNRLDKASDKSWTPVFDMGKRSLKTLKNGVLNLPASTPEEKSVEFLKQYSKDLFSVSADTLKFDRVVKTDRAKAVFVQSVDNLRVYGSTVALVFEDSLLMRVQNDLSALKPEPASQVMPLSEAERRVQTFGPQIVKGPSKEVTLVVNDANQKTELIYYPASDRLVKAYQMTVDVLKDNNRSERLQVIVNAHDGGLILSRSLRVE